MQNKPSEGSHKHFQPECQLKATYRGEIPLLSEVRNYLGPRYFIFMLWGSYNLSFGRILIKLYEDLHSITLVLGDQ